MVTKKQFRGAVHRRALSVGVVCVREPNAPNLIKSTVFTDFSFAFPATDEASKQIVICAERGNTFEAIRRERHFSLSILARERHKEAMACYKGVAPREYFSEIDRYAYISFACSIFFCEQINSHPMGSHPDDKKTAIFANILDLRYDNSIEPLINHDQGYWLLGDQLDGAESPDIGNERMGPIEPRDT